jgi:hypothetical protein
MIRPDEFFIERVPVDHHFGNQLDRWKALQRRGWNVSVLTNGDGTAVALGCRRREAER